VKSGQTAFPARRCSRPSRSAGGLRGLRLYDLRRPTHATAEFRGLFNAAVMWVLLVVLVTFVRRPTRAGNSFSAPGGPASRRDRGRLITAG